MPTVGTGNSADNIWDAYPPDQQPNGWGQIRNQAG